MRATPRWAPRASTRSVRDTPHIPRWLRYVRCEVLVIWGKESGLPPKDALMRPAAWSRGKRLEVIPDAAHWPHDEQSAKVNRLVIDFLEGDKG